MYTMLCPTFPPVHRGARSAWWILPSGYALSWAGAWIQPVCPALAFRPLPHDHQCPISHLSDSQSVWWPKLNLSDLSHVSEPGTIRPWKMSWFILPGRDPQPVSAYLGFLPIATLPWCQTGPYLSHWILYYQAFLFPCPGPLIIRTGPTPRKL